MLKDKFKLEKEFKENFEIHKFAIVASSMLYLKDMYDTPFLIAYKDKYLDYDESTRARKITDDMMRYNKALYDAMYEYCWQHIDEILPEDTCYRD